ncbi:MAG: cation-translocating P-type ATPase [Candidatus Nanoarchaeia archaeon]
MQEEINPNIETQKWKDILPAALGGILLINAVVAKFAFDDNGTNSAIASSFALLILLPALLRIVYDDFKHGRVHMNELVLLAVFAGICRGDLFIAGIIAFFMLLGLIVETRSASGAKESLNAITKMTRLKARRLGKNGEEEEVEAITLLPDEIIRVRPGETIPADGEIVFGNSSIQEANITGESIPVDKTIGAPVFAGTINLSGAIEVKVSKTGADTTLGKVKELILAAEKTRPKFIRMIDDYAKYYTPFVLMLAFFTWASSGHDFSRVVAVLVAACPIALVLSVPSAAVAALSSAARLGILIKKISDIEALSSITAFVFDKTGTLTEGELEVAEIAPVEGISAAELLQIAATAEKDSNHPVAKAVSRLAKKAKVKTKTVSESSEKPGRGVKAIIDGEEVIVGNLAWMKENQIETEAFPDFSDQRYSNMSMLFIVQSKKAIGWMALEDKVREEASTSIEMLKKRGISEIAIVTGDRSGVAKKVAETLKIKKSYGECSPTDKIARIELIKEKGHRIVFVGDGVNDAPALAASDIGIAMGAVNSGGLAVETATIALMNNRLDRIPFLLDIASAYHRIMIQNFIVGAVFIVSGVVAGASGKLGGMEAAFLQATSAIVIVMNSARLVRKGATN